jgi:hypothetical protein
MDEHAHPGAGALRGVHEQLRAIMRICRAEEADGQRLPHAPGRPVAAHLFPDVVLHRHRLTDDVDEIRRVAFRGEGAAHRVRDGEDRRQ